MAGLETVSGVAAVQAGEETEATHGGNLPGEDVVTYRATFKRPKWALLVDPKVRAQQLVDIFSEALKLIPGYILATVKQCAEGEAFCISLRTNREHQVASFTVDGVASRLTTEKVGNIISDGTGLKRRLITVEVKEKE